MKNTITQTVIIINVETPVTVGDAIKATLVHQISLYRDEEGKIQKDIEYTDVQDIIFMGVPTDGTYGAYQNLCKSLLGLGIDLKAKLNEESRRVVDELVNNFDIKKYKSIL